MEERLKLLEEKLEEQGKLLAFVLDEQVKLLKLFSAQWLLPLLLMDRSPNAEVAQRLGDIIGLHPQTVLDVLEKLKALLEASSVPPGPGDKPVS